ncbi:DUF4430 domain-containing protein [Mucilaginibacter polytrichastri]|uniref:Transcobalamin-like C-terminal domain-containing protein n=1 Tax=Mucilaginibacter polytrichastri TaxID=1302689 RepID=A0A1Q5ZSM0_9SPHI|nr:DUF4430 domain-containing protein [Mucilaginibacter polytrichastri]OKS84770.1 hypothetical protein RG47T_0203 [Mucilaginibacter polytrichastri]SFT00531.1 protein of unknown function [Mucilaginibacter polytrichastri]
MVTITITGGPSVQVPWQAGMNGQIAIEAAYNALSPQKSFTYVLQYYGSQYGYLVEMINGTYDSFVSTYSPYFFWDFIVNGAASNMGIDGTNINDNDVITFTYTLYNAIIHVDTVLAAKFQAKSTI